jgi:hypothetical protein
MAWTTGQWNQEVAPNRNLGFSGTRTTGWLALQAGLTRINARLDVSNAGGAFTNPFDVHPFNSPALSVEYTFETSVDGTDATAMFLAGGVILGSANGLWPTKSNATQNFPTASADLPQTPYPGFYRATITVLNAATVTVGVSVNPT